MRKWYVNQTQAAKINYPLYRFTQSDKQKFYADVIR